MSNHNTSRFGFKWNVNECLRLQREFELLKLSVPEIAGLHGRTIKAIIYKISEEGFASFNDLFVQTYGNFIEEHVEEYVEVLQFESVIQDLHEEDEEDEEYDDLCDDLCDDSDFIPNELSDSEDDEDDDDDDGSNKHYLYSQVKRMQKQISSILGYLTKGKAAITITNTSLESYGGV